MKKFILTLGLLLYTAPASAFLIPFERTGFKAYNYYANVVQPGHMGALLSSGEGDLYEITVDQAYTLNTLSAEVDLSLFGQLPPPNTVANYELNFYQGHRLYNSTPFVPNQNIFRRTLPVSISQETVNLLADDLNIDLIPGEYYWVGVVRRYGTGLPHSSFSNFSLSSNDVSAVPEPSTLLLFGIGAVGMWARKKSTLLIDQRK